MKNGHSTKVLVVCLVSVVIAVAGCCCVNICDVFKAKYERTVQVSAPIAPRQALDVYTDVGSITVTGGDFTDCSVTAKITVKASTEEKARKLAEETQIKLEPADDRLKVKIEKPPMADRDAIFVSFSITVPRQTALDLQTNVGELEVDNITEYIRAKTNVGKITCREITGRTDLTTNGGEVMVVYAKNAPAACHADISTSVGKIDFAGPDNLSAAFHASANVGSIETRLPLTVTGKIGKSIDGAVGAGEGKVTLEANVGSIKIR
ncbi:MAG: DUF4097 domain-containing protein [Sedimentisphaerales bacterium]|nr:DUF4097 domain-containing protein [Sedimentisphaerales bacterium]